MADVRQVAKGAFAGAVATLPMSAVMVAAQRAGYLGEMPPDRITSAVMKAVNAKKWLVRDHDALSFANHVAFGATSGAAYAALRQPGPRAVPDIIAGISFGLAVWLISYEGWLPKLGLFPKVQWDRPGRPESMAAAHVVFGGTLAGVLRRIGA